MLSGEEGEAELSLPAPCACNRAIQWIKKNNKINSGALTSGYPLGV